eukprot:CAMPEP_0204469774 /NCGR_PEP_ID=MMETSP0471-20130131/15740_1 /ASSEMBLY_ACC=CAM_ASM_000602 /TAXON_ID=2969 /ORGANISM="Oxyrrhis marina" /LENGTH=159 /DNA_ID=CAMNT_0051471721 /DNA_START=177 /DNA_END=652 /DNA_ORIENTATION=-
MEEWMCDFWLVIPVIIGYLTFGKMGAVLQEYRRNPRAFPRLFMLKLPSRTTLDPRPVVQRGSGVALDMHTLRNEIMHERQMTGIAVSGVTSGKGRVCTNETHCFCIARSAFRPLSEVAPGVISQLFPAVVSSVDPAVVEVDSAVPLATSGRRVLGRVCE